MNVSSVSDQATNSVGRGFRVMVQHRTRPDKTHPLAYTRHTVYGVPDAVQAATVVLGRPKVAALGNLLVSLTVSAVGERGTKP